MAWYNLENIKTDDPTTRVKTKSSAAKSLFAVKLLVLSLSVTRERNNPLAAPAKFAVIIHSEGKFTRNLKQFMCQYKKGSTIKSFRHR